MKDFKGQEKTVVRKTSEEVRILKRGKASCPGASTRRADSGTSGSKVNTHHGGRFIAALLVVLLSFIMILGNIPQIAFADDLVNTVPDSETSGGASDFYTDTINTGLGTNGPSSSGVTYYGYGPGYGTYNSVTTSTGKSVYQSQSTASPTSFAAGLPLGTIFIDQSMIPEGGGTTEIVSKNTSIIAGLYVDENNRVLYDGNRAGAIKMVPNKINELKEDLVKVTFSDAAILPNGERADLVITYSNARIVIDERYNAAPDGTKYYEIKRWRVTSHAGLSNKAPTDSSMNMTATGESIDGMPIYKVAGTNKEYAYRKEGNNHRYYSVLYHSAEPVNPQPTGLTTTAETFNYNGKNYTVYTKGTQKFFKPDEAQHYQGAVSLVKGNSFAYGGTDTTDMRDTFPTSSAVVNATVSNPVTGFNNTYTYGNAAGSNNSPVTGLTIDATYQIVNKDGTPAAGTFVFAVCGINLDRDPDVGSGNNTAKPLWYSYDTNFDGQDGTAHSFFSEAMEITGGQASDYVYVRPNTNQEDNPGKITGVKGQYFYPNVSLHNGNIKFIGNQVDANLSGVTGGLGGNDNSYNAGFVTLADAAKGFKVTASGHGSAGASMNSYIFNSQQIWYRYTSTTGPNGNIQITADGNYNKQLTDGSNVLGPGTYVVAEGKTVTYTMTPDVGYKIKTLQIADKNGVMHTVKFDSADIEKMKKGDTVTWTTAAGDDGIKRPIGVDSTGAVIYDDEVLTGTLKYEEDGTYSFVFPYAKHDEKIHVEWQPTTADILVSKIWNDSNDKDGMRAGADGTEEWPKVKLQRSIDGGATWTNVEKNSRDETITPQNVPSGKDENSTSATYGEYLDGTFVQNNDPNKDSTDPNVVKHPYTWQYLPVYTYDSNGKADRMILYRLVEGTQADLDVRTYSGTDPAFTGYKSPEYKDGQSFYLTSEETKATEGWLIYKDSTSGKYYNVRDGEYYEVNDWVASSTPVPESSRPNPDKLEPVSGSEEPKVINGEQVVKNPTNNKEYVVRGTKYYEVFFNQVSANVAFDSSTYSTSDPDYDPTNPKTPDTSTFANALMNGYNTADKGIPYQSVSVKNEHTVSDIEVEITKNWNDDDLYNGAEGKRKANYYQDGATDEIYDIYKEGDNEYVRTGEGTDTDPYVYYEYNNGKVDFSEPVSTPPTNPVAANNSDYDRSDIVFTLRGTIKNASGDDVPVDLDPNSANDYLQITLSKTEANDRVMTSNGKTVYRDATTEKKYVREGSGTDSDPYVYYEVSSTDDKNAGTTGSYSATPVPAGQEPRKEDIKPAYNEAYKTDGYNYGVVFDNLQAYDNGQEITYTVTESLNRANSFTVTGGAVKEEEGGEVTYKLALVGDKYKIVENQEIKGYKGGFINTPIIDDEINSLPVTIKKLDAYTGMPLQGAEFTVYTNYQLKTEVGTSTYKQINGLTLLKDSSDGKFYVRKADGKYYVVTGGTTIASKAADPQPNKANLTKVEETNYKKVTVGGREYTVFTDKQGHRYVKIGSDWREVSANDEVAAEKADPQPNESDLTEIKVAGEVDEIKVITDENGLATINFNRTGTYTIAETNAPAGYTADGTPYQIEVDQNLNKVTYMNPDTDHQTNWWKRIWNLIFGDETIAEEEGVWEQGSDERSGTLTVKDTPLTAHVLVRKVWDDEDDQDGARPTGAEDPETHVVPREEQLPTMTLQYTTKNPNDEDFDPETHWDTAEIFVPAHEDPQNPGTIIPAALVDVDTKDTTYAGGAIHKDNNNAYTWIDLPAYRDGKVVYYRIKETGTILDDEIYKVTKNETVATGDENFNLVDDDNKPINQIVEVTNTHTPQILTIRVVKNWVDNDNSLGHRPGTLKITLYREIDNKEGEEGSIVLDGRGEIPDESAFDKDESGLPLDDTVLVYDLDGDGTEDATEKGAYDAAVAAGEKIIKAGVYEVDVADPNSWEAVFKDLPAFANGAPIKYRLEETLDDTAKVWYVNTYYVNYTDTAGVVQNVKFKDSLVADDIQRTFVDKIETIEVGGTSYDVYIKDGKKYVRTGEGTDPDPYIYYEITGSGTDEDPYGIATEQADPQPTNPTLSEYKQETTEAILRVDNTSKNNLSTRKYWLGGANVNVRFYLYRTIFTQYENKTTGEKISVHDYNQKTEEEQKDYKPVVPAMDEVNSTAAPIKTGTTVTVESKTYDVYNHSNGKKYVNKNETGEGAPEWHELTGDGTTESPYSIDSAVATIKITTWTPYDLDGNGDPQYVNKNDSSVISEAEYNSYVNKNDSTVVSQDEYNALPVADKENYVPAVNRSDYEIKLKSGWERVTEGSGEGQRLFTSSEFDTSLVAPGDMEPELFQNLPQMDGAGNPYEYRIFETTQDGAWTDDRFEAHYGEEIDAAGQRILTVTNINKLMEEGTAKVDVLKDLSGREWDAKYIKNNRENEADKDVFYFWIEPIKSIDETTGEIIEFTDSQEDQDAKAAVPLPGNGEQYGRALNVNTAVGTARAVSFSPILYDATDIDATTKTSTFYYKVYEAKDNQGTIVEEKDDQGITYDADDDDPNTPWKPKVEIMKVVATADANNVVTAEHSWASLKRSEAGAVTGVEWTTQAPVFENVYSSYGEAKAWIEKNIQSRAWEDYANESGDAFQFTITSIAGAMLNTPGAQPNDSYVTNPLVTSGTTDNPQHDLQKLSNSMWAFGVNGNPYTGELLGKKGEAYFIYEITENGSATSDPERDQLGLNGYTVDGLTYDDSRIFAKVKVTDNWDGTLSFDVRYYTDASCKNEITKHTAWIVDKLLIEEYVSKSDPSVKKTVEQYNALSDAEKKNFEAVYNYVSKTDPFAELKTAAEYKAMSDTEKAKYTNRLKRLLTEEERTQANAMKAAGNTAGLTAAGYKEVHIAHFENRETIDIPVKKQWIGGPAIEDVTLHLERHLFPLTDEAGLDGDSAVTFVQDKNELWDPKKYINKTNYDDVISKAVYDGLTPENRANYEECGPFWERLGYVYDVRRGEFLKQNGDPRYDAGSNTTSSLLIENEDGFNKDLPKYVVKNGITYRAVYLLVEDNTSDAYTRSYSPEYSVTKNGVETTGALYVNNQSLAGADAALVVKNTVVATNTANIAAVKQLLGRNWIKDTDDFEFELIPYGVAVYNENDEIVDIDKSEAGKAKVPMPEKNTSLYSDTVIKGYINKNDETTPKTEAEYSALPKVSQGNYKVDPTDNTKYINKEDPDDVITAVEWAALTDGESKQDYVAQKESTTHAKENDGAIVVDPNGNLERLARFGAITYTTSDLEYDKTDRHMQGDFYYIMREKLPEIVTTGANQNYPVEYTVVKNKGTAGETTETKAITNKAMPTLGDGETLKSVKFSNGITYDCDEHKVHVKVRENRTEDLQVQIAYDWTDQADISSGTQFTPVYTNKYEAETEVTVPVNKYIMGRDWVASDNFDFRMIPMAGAPFTDADPTDFPEQNTYSHTERNTQLDAGNAVHNKEGEHVIRVTPDKGTTGDKTGTHDPVSFDFPAIKINISDLNKVITEENRTAPEENKPDFRVYDVTGYNMAEGAEKETHLLPLGTVYGQFMYAIEETKEFNDVNANVVKDLEPDPDTEYARITVYDTGDGELKYYVEIFEDRYGTIPRYIPNATGGESDERATAVTFANKLKRNLKATKAWAGSATEDVTLKLQWSINGTNFYDVDGSDWFPYEIEGTKVIKKGATGKELTVEWENLPAYANISSVVIEEDGSITTDGADDKDLNDKWVYYQVIEEKPTHATVKYNETPYNETSATDVVGNTEKFKDVPFHTGAQFKEGTENEYLKPTDRVTQLYVTNFPEDIPGKANVGVVKQYIGKEWNNEEFEFKITPVKSKLAGDSDYINEGDDRTVKTYVNNDTGVVIGPVEYEGLSDTDKAKYTEHESTEVNHLPEYTGTNGNIATAKKTSNPNDKVSVNEFAANFKELVIKRSDLGHDPDTNLVGGEFIYKITEVLPPGAQKTDEVCGQDSEGNNLYYYVADDGRGNKIKYTTVEHLVKIVVKDDGSGELDVEVSFDDRNSGEYVPVYTNYALTETPIEGEKKWVGGEKATHHNGTVALMNENTEIDPSTEPIDELGLKLQRSTDGENFSDVAEDEAGNKLYIVWAKQTRTPVDTYSYNVTEDTSVDPNKTYYDESTGDAITPEGTENPKGLGWCERTTTTTYKYEYTKQEGEEATATGKGSSGPYTYTIKAKKETKDPQTGVVTNTEYVDPYLDTTDKDGNEYIYRIQEIKVPTNYKERYDPVKPLNVTNIYDVTDNLKVTKTWDDAQGVEGTRPEEVIVHLYKEVIVPAETPGGSATTKTVQVEVDKKTITKQGTETDSWSTGITWEDLPLYDDNGNVIKYFVLEEGIGGYVAKYAVDSTAEADYKAAGDASLKIELDGNSTHAATQAEVDAGLAENVGDTITVTPQTIDIKNSLTPATNTVKVTKVWDDQNNIDGARPTDVTFQLYKYVWDPDANSGKGAYKTTEELVSGTSGTGRPATKADVDADKAAKGDQSTMKVGDIIKIEDLVLDGTAETDEDGSTPSTDDDVDTQANETAPTNTYTWNGEWINLPLTEKGKTILYVVKEVIPTGTDSAYADPGTPGKYSNKPVIIGDQIKGYTVTNEYTPEETTFVGTKSWVDGDTSITHNNSAELMSQLHLYRTTVAPADWDDSTTWTDMGLLSTGVANGDYHVDWTTKTQKDDTFTITGLAKKDGSGKTYYYKIVEAEITGYETTYLNNAATVDALKTKTDALYSGGTVENAAKVGDVEITKKFVDSENNIIPKAVLPAGFKIKVSYVWNNPTSKKFETKTEELTIGDLTADADGNYKWTLERVVAGTKVTAEEVGYDSPTGYSYVSTTTTVNGDDDATHVSENPTYAEFTMPAGAANTTPAVRNYNSGSGGNTKPSIALVNTYNRDKGAIAPIKIWDDDSDAASTRPDSVTFTITATKDGDLNNTYAVIDDGTGTNTKVASINYTMTKTDNSGDEWFINEAGAFEIGDLPTHADDGTQICYVITENTVPTGYQRLYPQADVGGIKIRLNKGDYKYAEITNSYTEFVVTKKWIDVDGTTATPTAVRPPANSPAGNDYKSMVKLYAGSEDVTAANASKLTVTDNGDGTYTLKWTGLPKRTGGDLTKPEIVYSVVENPNPITGYSRGVYSNPDNPNTRANEASETSKALKGGTITNTQLVKVSVVKEWNDNGNHDNQRPEQIKVTLYQNGVPYGSEKTLTKATATVGANAGNDTWTWTDAWTNLPYADANGSVYNYTATETNLGTGTDLWGNLDNEATIRQILLNEWNTNKDTLTFSITNTDAEDKIGFTVDKIWNDASDVDNLRPDTINYRLYQSWEGHAEELVKALPTGATVKTVTNGADPVLASYANGYITIASKKTDETQGTLNRVIFEGLPKFAAGGKEITYTIKEDGDVTNDTVNDTTVNVTIDPIRGYNIGNTDQMPTIGGSQTAGYTVTNSHTPVRVSVSPNAIKQIAGRKFRNGEEFTFKLESTSTDAPMPTPGWVTIKTGLTDILSNTKNIPLGTFTFTGEDMTDKLNAGDTKTFTYKLSEVNGGKTYDDLYYDHSELTLKITVTRKADGTLEIPASGVVWGDGSTGSDTFVNRYGANTILTLRKVWVDDDADGTVLEARPTSVDFTVTAEIATDDGVWADAENKLLLADFTKVNSKKYTKVYTLTTGDAAAQDTEHTWQIDTEELPKMDAAGDAIIYSVSEDQLPNYKEPKLVQKGNLYTITNEYDRITFTGTKVWIDGGKTHDNVTELKDALTVEREETVYVYDGTSYSTRAAAEAQATTDGVDPADFNTVITTDKEWKTVTDANLHIHWNGDGAASGGKYTQSFTVTGLLEKDALGNAYKYRVVEDGTVVQAINPDYVVSYDNSAATDTADQSKTDAIYNGGKVENKLEAEKEITAEKVWVGGDAADHDNSLITSVELWRESTTNGGAEAEAKVAAATVIDNWTATEGDAEFDFGAIDSGTSAFVTGKYDKYDDEGFEYRYFVKNEVLDPSIADMYIPSYEDLTVTNTYKYTEVEVTKKWTGKPEADVTIKLLADGTEVADYTFAVDDLVDGKYTHTFTKKGTNNAGPALLDRFTATGDEVVYTVQEVNGDLYDADIIQTGSGDWVVINTGKYIDIAVRKVWDDKDDHDGLRPDAIEITLLQNGTAYSATGFTNPAVLNEDNNWTYIFKELPRKDTNGDPYVYKVTEGTAPTWLPPTGYTVSYLSEDATDSKTDGTVTTSNEVTITNRHAVATEDVVATKVWDDGVAGSAEMHTDVVLHLYGTNSYGRILYDAGTKKIEMDANHQPLDSNGNPIEVRWTDLPSRHYSNEDLIWVIVEEAVPGYSSKVEEVSPNNFKVTNTYDGPVTKITVEKDWQDNDDVDGKRPTTVSYQLWKKVGDSAAEKVGVAVEAVKTPASPATDATGQLNNWGYQWTNLPTTEEVKTGTENVDRLEVVTRYRNIHDDTNISADEYDVLPASGPTKSDYELKTQVVPVDPPRWINGDGTIELDQTDYEDLTPAEQAEYTPVTEVKPVDPTTYVNKNDGTEKNEAEYNALTEWTKADYEPYDSETSTPEAVDVYETKPVIYYVTEEYTGTDLETNGYEEPVIEALGGGQYKAINTRKRDTKNLEIQKVWNDNDNADGVRPDHVTFKLTTEDGQTYIHAGEKTIANILVGEDNGWKVVIHDVPVNQDGAVNTPVKYIVEELTVPTGYHASYFSEDAAGDKTDGTIGSSKKLTVTNTHTPGETMTIRAIKKWQDSDGTELPSQPHEVKFRLIQVHNDGTIKDMGYEQTIPAGAEGDDLIVIWTGLPETVNHLPVTYTVEEEPIDGYTTIMSDGVVDPEPGIDLEITVTNKKHMITITYKEPAAFNDEILQGPDEIARDQNEPDAPADPVHPGYTFLGWTRVEDASGNVVYTAKYAELVDVVTPCKVTYVDPKAADGSMILKATKYNTSAEADDAAQNKTDKPENPSHENYDFVGWVLNQDQFGDWILVAKYNEKLPEPAPAKKTTSYIDPVSGKLIKSEVTDDPSSVIPPTPSTYGNMQFVEWAEIVDANGNTVFVAKYATDCKNAPPSTPADPPAIAPPTGDENNMMLWIYLAIAALATIMIVLIIRRRNQSR